VKNINEAINISNSDIAKYLHLPPIKLHCSMLAENAIKSAINNLKKK
jgi:nitrogen fixation NifU-like protein